MFRTVLRTVVFAFAALGAAAPAYADAMVENAQKLWEGELRSAYDTTLGLIEGGKTNAAKDPAAELQDLTVRMAAEAAAIRKQAGELAPELGAAWADTETLMNNFNQRSIWLRNAIGKGKIDLSPIRSDWAAADAAFKKSVEFTKAFGKSYGQMIENGVEPAKELYDGYLNEGYKTTLGYLKDENTDDGKVQVDRLVEIAAQLYQNTGTASSSAAFARPLQDMWRPAHDAAYKFQEATQDLSELVGESEFDTDDMESAYADLNAAIVRAYKDVWDFGGRLRVISDNWG